jgi:hypothetical protein
VYTIYSFFTRVLFVETTTTTTTTTAKASTRRSINKKNNNSIKVGCRDFFNYFEIAKLNTRIRYN